MNTEIAALFANRDLIDEMYSRWQTDADSVDESWRLFFQGFDLALRTPAPEGAKSQSSLVKLIYTYRQIGHFLAHLDPLNESPVGHPLLELEEFGFAKSDLKRTFDLSNFGGLEQGTLEQLLDALHETYCRTIGVEFMHILDTSVQQWLKDRMEPCRNRPNFSKSKKHWILKRLYYAELFENFLHVRYRGQKRFSLEGAETLIPMLEAIVEKGPEVGVEEIVLGMAHRGRLNVLTNILRKPYKEIFAQFEQNYLPGGSAGDGDVKYHLGFSSDRKFADGRTLHLSLTPNPSHLEAVNPVVEGRVRAKQMKSKDLQRTRGIPLLLHGDAAFAGQGLVAETLNLSQLSGYTTGGTIHIVINNQIGFTTGPGDGRSTVYCTDLAKMIDAPIFHVNFEDPEAAVFLAELALDFRQTFHRDVVIDLYCYRKFGHNEGDEPAFTQPLMYEKIRQRPSVTKIYSDRLLEAGELSKEHAEKLQAKFEEKLQSAVEEVQAGERTYPTMRGYERHWQAISPEFDFEAVETGVEETVLLEVADALVRLPEGFEAHKTIMRGTERRMNELREGEPVPWGIGELLAFGSLLVEKTHIRFSGQDCQRGTFSHRHAVLIDQNNGEAYTPLNHIDPEQERACIFNSPLSEAGVLGFEYGYSLDAPEALVLWEAQFGDFANGAQVIIDQFLASSASKWSRDSGLVMLLPHGYEGQGPEHSSARLERYLQLCAEDNMQVVNPTTPAQYFHLLRRQVRRSFRKPLIVMTPKSLLRHHRAVSRMDDFVSGRFHEIIDDNVCVKDKVERVVLCSGKVYYDLLLQRENDEIDNVALVRIEQLYPLHESLLESILAGYGNATTWVWVQEESQNNGAWSHIEPRLPSMGIEVHYVGRDASASPATGSLEVHKREQDELVEAALLGDVPHIVRFSSRVEATAT